MKTLPESYTNISGLDHFHQYTDELFETHQIALMDNLPQRAVDILGQLEQLMLRHIKDEENLLLPRYEDEIRPVPAGGAVEFYRREHRQILGFLRRFIDQQPDDRDVISIVHYFDLCTMYKDLTGHHHARERTFLYRLLDGKLTAEVKTKILNTFIGNQKNAG